MNAILTKPANLDNSKLHTPEESAKWKADTAAYFQSLRDSERQEQLKAQAATAYANRVLTSDEYHALAVIREAEKQAKQAERDAAEKAAALAEIDRLMASPASVEVINRSEHAFILEVIQWANRGYVLADNGLMAFMPGIYHIFMDAPAQPAKKAK